MHIKYRDEETKYEKEFDIPDWFIVIASIIISIVVYISFS